MRGHVVENNKVVNTIEVASLDYQEGLIDGSTGAIGWSWDGTNLTPPATSNEELVEIHKGRRESLLLETDFYALSDVTMTDAMTAYRQALRDLPAHSNWPNLESGDWPTKP